MGRYVLIVEDDKVVADHLATLVRDELGCVPVVTSTSGDALDLIGERCDFGFLDIKVADGDVYPLAARLSARGVPFVFVSASDPAQVPPELAKAPFLRKPVAPPRLLEIARRHL
jgi:CheY-like chemotaxis protein